MVGSIENSQSLNRYAYANGNPMIYVDPLGHAPEGTGKAKNFSIQSVAYVPTYAPRISFPSLGEVAAGAAGAASKALGVFGGVILDMLINATPTSDEDWDPYKEYPQNPDDWVPPEGVTETDTGRITDGKHRQWKDQDGNTVRRWDRGESDKPGWRGKDHWHDQTGRHVLPD